MNSSQYLLDFLEVFVPFNAIYMGGTVFINCFTFKLFFLLVGLPMLSLLDKSSFKIIEKTSLFASVSF